MSEFKPGDRVSIEGTVRHPWMTDARADVEIGDGRRISVSTDDLTLIERPAPTPQPEPFTFQRDDDGTLSLESAVFQALGAASTCWERTPTGVFDSDRAKEIGDALLALFRPALTQDVEIVGWDEFPTPQPALVCGLCGHTPGDHFRNPASVCCMRCPCTAYRPTPSPQPESVPWLPRSGRGPTEVVDNSATPTPQPAVIDAAHLAHQREWSAATFGPGDRLAGVLDHIRKELAEVQAAPDDASEWADLIILAFDGALRQGIEPQVILDAIKAKQEKNEARTWPDWRTQPTDRAIEHDRSGEPVAPQPEPTGLVERVARAEPLADPVDVDARLAPYAGGAA